VALELADIFRRYGPAYRQKYASKLLPSHRQAMRAIERCRTEALGGQVYHCASCGETRYSYHSCRPGLSVQDRQPPLPQVPA